MKLIDLDELMTTVEVDMDVSVTGQKNMEAVKRMMHNILEDIKDSPVIDAVPVIRCKDCIHFEADDLETYCPLTGMYSLDINHYCAWAERKQNGIQD